MTPRCLPHLQVGVVHVHVVMDHFKNVVPFPSFSFKQKNKPHSLIYHPEFSTGKHVRSYKIALQTHGDVGP